MTLQIGELLLTVNFPKFVFQCNLNVNSGVAVKKL